MFETIDAITVNYEDNGVQTVKELDKKVLTKGAWTTICFKYQDWIPKDSDYGPVKYTIRRYQKRNGVYKIKSKFNISNNDQAKMLIKVLEEWMVVD